MKYFTDKELVCRHCGQLPPFAKENIEALVDHVLDPLREAYGKPIHVTSGYRCPTHNTAVGGVPNSQHTKGEAADITAIADPHGGALSPHCGLDPQSLNYEIARILVQQNNFDQMILYVTAGSMNLRFIHVSYKRNGQNRHRILKQVSGTKGYSVVTPSSLNPKPSTQKERRPL